MLGSRLLSTMTGARCLRTSIMNSVMGSSGGSMRIRQMGSPLQSRGMVQRASSSSSATTGGPGGGSGNGGGRDGGGGGGGGPGGEGAGKGSVLSLLWGMYMSSLERRPLTTKVITTAILNGVGDAICQFMYRDGGSFDWQRLGRFVFLGGALVAPALHTWYGTLGRLVKAKGALGAALRLALDQGVFAPIFISVFVSSLLTLEGNASQILAKLRQDLGGAVVANWKIWVPANFINFRFVPGNLQVLWANMVAIVWNVVLSYLSNKAVTEDTTVAKKK